MHFSLIRKQQITPRTELPPLTLPSFGNFTIDQIADGITQDGFYPFYPGPFNGFASREKTGTITLDLEGDFDLNSFILWNDINILREGIKDFRLHFFNNTDTLITSSPSFAAPIGEIDSKKYVFNDLIFGVSRVDLEVISSHDNSEFGINRIEIREVEFTGRSALEVQPESFIKESLKNITIHEGESAHIEISAIDKNPEPLEFFLNGRSVGIDPTIFGTRSVSVPLGLFPDNGQFTNTAYVKDSSGQVSNTTTQTVTVENVAPSITQITSDLNINEGALFNFNALAFDPGLLDVLSYEWDLDGDGFYGEFIGQIGQHVFPQNGSYKLGLRVSDEDGGSTEGGFNVTVQNVAPTITQLTGDLTVKSNEIFSFFADAFDPGQFDELTFAWDLDDDGQFDDFFDDEGQWIFKDPGTFKVSLQVSDGDGGVAEQSFSVTSIPDSFPPNTPTFSIPDKTITEGQTVDITLSATDVDPEALSFFLNDELIGTDPTTSGIRSVSSTLGPFVDEGTFKNAAYVRDSSDKESGTATQTLTVLNVAPTITQLTENLTTKPNQFFDFFAEASDPGILDELTFDWDLNADGLFDDFTGKRGQWLFPESGLFDVCAAGLGW